MTKIGNCEAPTCYQKCTVDSDPKRHGIYARTPYLLAEATRRVEQIGFSMLRMKLQDSSEGPGWDDEQCDIVEREYRRYLILNLVFPERGMAPSKDVDTFWHYHILDTGAYESDCREHLGFFLHHFPYLGLRGPEDVIALHEAGLSTLASYRELFGETPPVDVWWEESPQIVAV